MASMTSLTKVVQVMSKPERLVFLFEALSVNCFDIADDCLPMVDINDCFENGSTILNRLIRTGKSNDDNWKWLIDNGFEINRCSDDGMTALDLACRIGAIDDVRRALHYNACIHYPVDSEWHTVLGALYTNNLEILKLLNENLGIDWSRVVSPRFNPVNYLIQRWDDTKLLEYVLNLNILDYVDGQKCLLEAVLNNKVEAAELLIKAGVDYNALIPNNVGYGIDVYAGRTYYCLRMADVSQVKNNKEMSFMLSCYGAILSTDSELKEYKKRRDMKIIE